MATSVSGEPIAPRPSRPLGVAILAVLSGLVGIVLLLGGILALVATSVIHIPGLEAVGFIFGIVTLIVGLILLGVAVGLWRLRMWALVLAILAFLVELVLTLSPLVSAPHTIGLTRIAAAVVLFLLLVYLAAVRRHFR